MGGAMSRRKGAVCERDIANWLKARGLRARRFLAGDGKQPGDLDVDLPITIEAKDCVTWEPQKWMRQVEAEARPGTLPVVWAKSRGVTDPGEWIMLVRAKTLLAWLPEFPEEPS